MIIPIGADHAGFSTKQILIDHLKALGHEIKDFGCHSEQSIDYPDYAHPVAQHIADNPGAIGILLCGSANGISMTANKHQHIRCAVCWTTEIASLARLHNNANIVAIPARFITEKQAKQIVDVFLSTAFEGGRHALRVDKIPC